jgi:hypothetical protein
MAPHGWGTALTGKELDMLAGCGIPRERAMQLMTDAKKGIRRTQMGEARRRRLRGDYPAKTEKFGPAPDHSLDQHAVE